MKQSCVNCANRSGRFAIAVFCLASLLFAPIAGAVWPTGGGSELVDQAIDIKVGPSGDVYALGQFQGTADIDGQILGSNNGLDDLFVARISPAGSVIWVATAGSTSAVRPSSMAIDEAENIYVGGSYFGSASFGGIIINSGAIPTSTGRTDTTDAFVAKLNGAGQWQWASEAGSHNDDVATGVFIVPGNNSVIPPVPSSVLVTGSFRCFIDYPDENGDKQVVNGAQNCTSGEQVFQDMFVGRLSTEGDWQYLVRRPNSSRIENIKHAEVSPIDGRLFITGDYASQPNGRTVLNHGFNGTFNGWTRSRTDRTGLQTVLGRQTAYLRWSSAQLTSPTQNLANDSLARISYTVIRGSDAFNEDPDSGEDLNVEYRNASGQWIQIDRLFGNGTPGEVITRGFFDLPQQALHANFAVRFNYFGGSGSDYDYWNIDNVEIRAFGPDRQYLTTVTNTLGDGVDVTFGGFQDVPQGIQINDLEVSPDLQTLAVGGDVTTAQNFCVSNLGAGGFIAGFNTTTLFCNWIEDVPNGSVNGVTAVPIDGSTSAFNVYATGRIVGDTTFFNDTDLSDGSDDGTLFTADTGSACGDVYVASLIGSAGGTWEWVTGGGNYDSNDGVPGRAGGGLCDTGVAIASDGVQGLYVTGNFQDNALFGEDQSILSFGEDDVFIANLTRSGVWFDIQSFTVGIPLTPPVGAELNNASFVPRFFVDGVQFNAIQDGLFYWQGPVAGNPARLIPLQETDLIDIFWYQEGTQLQDERFLPAQSGIAVWPTEPCTDASFNDCYQVHVATSPVEIEPTDDSFTFLQLIKPTGRENDGAVDAGIFTASTSGFASLLFVAGSQPDPTVFPAAVQVVRTLPFSAAPRFESGVPWEIGQKVVDAYHNELGRTGLVLNEAAMYDGVGANAAYNRAARTGTIVPVNRVTSSRPQDAGKAMVVSWYRRKAMNTFWPEKPVEYDLFWPLDPDLIVVASQQGGEALGQAPLDPLQFQAMSIYNQPDPLLPGYNPNDEHAQFFPSSAGTGLEAIFALRSDFGSEIDGDINAASDPYVLIKYFNAGENEWQFRVYKVLGTGAGFTTFRFDGVAGTQVAPPYPASLLVPGCPETRVVGQGTTDPQPPPPFFMDYKNQLWAASAGSGAVRYYYPAQAGFFVDLDNNDVNDIDTGECVPWLPRLPADRGGTDNPTEPILVAYDVVWPDNAAQLIPGETLLTPKRGLPDIVNQAAVQIAFDEVRDASATPSPDNALVQLIDPLNPRTVLLPALPEGVASELGEGGKRVIIGNAGGTTKLPVSVRDRLSFDPISGRLSFAGVFDESGAGEPLLLLNVMSKRDRDLLLAIDDSNSSAWSDAINTLFDLTRNPQQVQSICTASSLNEDQVRVCTNSRAITDDDVLIGSQDTNNDGVLEQFQAVGVSPALTAGFAQGNGFVTLVFNNDPTLNPAPILMDVIRIECLQSPPPPVLPGDADIYSSYQGQLQIISPENIFDEQLVLRHSGDFGGNPDALEFEWFFHPDIDGTPPFPLPDPDAGQLNGWIQQPVDNPMGAVEISIEGANIQTLSDNWYVARYRGLNACGNDSTWSLFAGQPGATPLEPRAQLAEGWVKRVLKRLNPFEARVQNFAQAATNNYASMLVQLGERYEGDIALNNDPDNLNSIGLIEAYTTVMRRAINLSSGATPPIDYAPANAAILLVASRLVDFYTLIGNEAYADAQDPTIGIDTSNPRFGPLAPAIFNFQNQLASLLEEELVLLRGRDDSNGPVAANPVYNRLFWNFTTGDGEVAYALSYNISDQNTDGVIDEFDARILFPQGHGDAWGHYLTALDIYYDLLRHPFFTWDPRAEAITVAGVPITVDFLDERQFAETAAAKARTGAEVVDLTYRLNYVDDPAGQWQGYKDTDLDRAWGLSEWGRRAGQGSYFDWVTGNAIVQVEEPDPDKVGIQRVDRSTVSELNEIIAQHSAIQGQVDEADQGLNPLGLAKGVVPFDIDPSQIDAGLTHFEQVFDRAQTAMDNAVEVWDFANNLNRMLRQNQNEVDDITRDANATEVDFKGRLIEIFGYPYADDIGPGGIYPAGYDGPDLYHYQYVDTNVLEGTAFDRDGCPANDPTCVPQTVLPSDIKRFDGTYQPVANGFNFFSIVGEDASLDCGSNPLGDGCSLGSTPSTTADVLTVPYTTIETDFVGTAFVKPPEWTGQRRAPGELQNVLSELLQARVALERAFREYENLRIDVNNQIDTIRATLNIRSEQISIANSERRELNQLTITNQVFQNSAIVARRAGEIIEDGFKAAEKCVPKSAIFGLAGGGDLLSGVRCSIKAGGLSAKSIANAIGDGLDIVANATGAAKEDVSQQAAIESQIQDARLEAFGLKGDLDVLLAKEPLIRSDVYSKAQTMMDLQGKYYAVLAEGQRTLEQLVNFRKLGAADIQEYRYEDLAFRLFRNDALQKYRAAFDLAARYTYLAATAYDYETNLLGSDAQAGQSFLTQIVRERSLGQIINRQPVPGSRGLADPMARMAANFEVLKGQMGFNNPQTETNRFSLRSELFRIAGEDADADAAWRSILENARVDDLWQIPEFRRFARPFAPESAGPQPGLVIRFPSTVSFGLNFFGRELGPGDSAYDSSQFATKIRGAGVWFGDYEGLPLSNTPRVYLFPVGADVLRAPAGNNFEVREWSVVDQVIPVPFQLGSQDLDDPDWLPADTLIGSSQEVRQFSRFRAYHFSEPFDESQVISDSRLIGRSVWNRDWMLVIPGETFLFDANDGLDTLIGGQEVPGGNGERDGNGISDILLFFQTYAYSGN